MEITILTSLDFCEDWTNIFKVFSLISSKKPKLKSMWMSADRNSSGMVRIPIDFAFFFFKQSYKWPLTMPALLLATTFTCTLFPPWPTTITNHRFGFDFGSNCSTQATITWWFLTHLQAQGLPSCFPKKPTIVLYFLGERNCFKSLTCTNLFNLYTVPMG